MVYVYYHIYATDDVDKLIIEQLELIQKHFNFQYELNIGISLSSYDFDISKILKLLPVEPRRVEINNYEFTTLELIKIDNHKFNDDDFIFYFHTKGVTSQLGLNWSVEVVSELKKNIPTWRKVMEYFNIEKVDYVFYVLKNTTYNTYGILYVSFYDEGVLNKYYAGNFWWGKGSYIKTLKMDNINKNLRMDAESKVIHSGDNWKPFSPYDKNVKSHYTLYFEPNEYRNLHLKYSFI